MLPVSATSGTLTVPISAPQYTGTLTVTGAQSPVTSGLTVDLTVASSIPAGFPGLPAATAWARSARTALAAGAAPVPLLSIEPVFSALVTGTGGMVVLHVPASVVDPADAYYIAYFDPNALAFGWQLGWAGPATVSGTTLTFNLSGPVAFDARTTYALVLFAVSDAAPKPTPAPTLSPTPHPSPSPSVVPSASPSTGASASPTPSASPSPSAAPSMQPSSAPSASPSPHALTISPSSIAIAGAGNTAQITVSEPGYTGAFDQTNSCQANGIASFSAASGSGPSWTVTITAQTGGTCSAVFSDSNGQQQTATIDVTTSGFTIQTTGRKEH
jgi:hypothetical protein